MNRRKFFNFLGSAIIGTAIALKLPNSLVPQLREEAWKGEAITYEMLLKAYSEAMKGSEIPDLIIVSPRQFAHIIEVTAPERRFYAQTATARNGFMFHGATLISDENIEDSEIKIEHTGRNYNANRPLKERYSKISHHKENAISRVGTYGDLNRKNHSILNGTRYEN